MRLLLPCLLAVCAMAQQIEAPSKARVAGNVVTVAGDPVRQATVILLGRQTLTQSTDAKGAFVFESVPPGAYSLVAAREQSFSAQKFGAAAPLSRDCLNPDVITDPGNRILFTNARNCIMGAPGATLMLAAGEERKAIVIKVVPHGKLTGHVTNRDGEPMQRWYVAAFRSVYSRGSRRLESVRIGSTLANADGSFSIPDLPPGRYYVRAIPAGSGLTVSGDRPGKPEPEADLPTYYPSSAGPSRDVELSAGGEARAEILLRRERVYCVRGAVVTPPNSGRVSDQILTLAPANDPSTDFALDFSNLTMVELMSFKQTSVRADGTFEFRNVEPGNYVLLGGMTGWGNPGMAAKLFGRQDVNVGGDDVKGVKLVMAAGVNIAGTVRREDGKAGPWPSVFLRETAGRNSMPGYPDEAGAFGFTNLAPSQFVVNVSAVPPGLYVKSIRFGTQDAMHALLDLTGGGGGALEVVLSSKVGSISGVVKNGAGIVALWPRTPEMMGGVRSASLDQNGRFEIGDLGPGGYFIAAFEDIDPGLRSDPAFLARFQNQAAAVDLEEGGNGAADLAVIPRARVAAEIAKLQ